MEKFNPEDSPIKSRNVAEAKFYRALCHFELTTLWGTPPKVDKVLKSTEEYKVSNSAQEDLWTFIETDLKEAIASGSLTSKVNMDDKDGSTRATLEAAEAMLGKVYLYLGKYNEAKSMFEKVISSKKYGLESDISILYHTAGMVAKNMFCSV